MYARLAEISRQRRERAAAEGGDTEEVEHDQSDVLYEELDISKYSPLVQAYITNGLALRIVVKHWIFSLFMNLCICLAGLLVGLQFYKSLENSLTISILEWFILVVFVVEVLLKIAMDPLRPWNYFIGKEWKWNMFDFMIVVLCMPFMPFGKWAMGLRLMRLMRVLKILAKYPELRMILVGLAAGMKSSSYIMLLLFLVFYLFGTAGLLFFGQGDPQQFGSYSLSFATLFRMSTMEDWTDVMYMNIYGCSYYPVGGTIVYRNATLFPEGYNGTDMTPSFAWEYSVPCENVPHGAMALIYFHLFIFVASLIVLSMFVGSIAIAMTEIMSLMQDEQARKQAEKLKQNGGEADVEDLSPDACLDVSQISDIPLSGRIRFDVIKHNMYKAVNQKSKSTHFYQTELGRLKTPIGKAYFCLGMAARKIAYSSVFSTVVALVICIAGFLVGLQTDGVITENETVELCIFIVFALETILKLVAEIFQPQNFFLDNWNKFDFIIVVCSIPGMPTGGYALILRLLRLLRVLKLLRALPQLQILVAALMNAFSSIGWIAVLLFLFFYISSILAIMAFGTNDPWHFANIHLAMMSLFRVATLEDWTDIMYIEQKGCDAVEAFPYLDPAHRYDDTTGCNNPGGSGLWAVGFFFIFVMVGNYVLLSLFIGIIAAEMESAMRKQQTEKQLEHELRHYCKKNNMSVSRTALFKKTYWVVNEIRPSEGIDFEVMKVCLELIGETPPEEKMRAWFRTCANRPPGGELNIFDFAVFLTNMPWRSGDQKMDTVNDAGNADDEESNEKTKEAESQTSTTVAGKLATGKGALACVARCGEWNRILTESDGYSNFMLSVVVFAGILVGAQIGYDMEENATLIALDYFVLVIFTIEIIQKIIAYPFTPWTFFTNSQWAWNWFDFVIVVLSMPGVFSAAGALRLLRLARLMKIINKVPKIKVIVSGLIAGLQSVVYILLLMFIVFYIYAVLGVTLFRPNDPFHFDNIIVAFQTLFRVATLEDWTDVWYINYYGCDYFTAIGGAFYTGDNSTVPDKFFPSTREELVGKFWSTGTVGSDKLNHIFCTPTPQPGLATAYFISFVAVAAFVLLSLFVGAILISTMDAVQSIGDQVKQLKAEHKAEAKKHAIEHANTLPMRKRRQQIGRSLLAAWEASKKTDFKKLAKAQRKAIGKLAQREPNVVVDVNADLDWQESRKFRGPMRIYFILAFYAHRIKETKTFSVVINICIMLASTLVGVSAAKTATLPEGETDDKFAIVDMLLLIIFTFEVVIGIVAEGFAPWEYFKDGWNRLDFIIVGSSYVPSITSLALLMRMVRLLRVLKVLRVFPELRMLVMALMQAKESILFVIILMLLVFYVFTIFALMLFKQNDPWHFGNLHRGMMTLFRVATGEDWTDVMYTAQMGCSKYPSSDPFASPEGMCGCVLDTSTNEFNCSADDPHGWTAVMFFVAFHMIGGLVFLNLFIGVITVGMADAIEFRDKEAEMDNRVSRLQRQLDLKDEALEYYRIAFDVLDMTDSLELEPESIQFALHSVYLKANRKVILDVMNQTLQAKEHDITKDAFDLDNFIRGMENDAILSMVNEATSGGPISDPHADEKAEEETKSSADAKETRAIANVTVKANKMVV